jgi:hypothetical protein
MLGAQILLGFQLQAPFQNQFGSLTSHEKAAETAVLCLMVLVLGLLIAPSAYHRIVNRGNATFAINLLITRMFQVTLLPFGIALGLAVGAAFARIGGSAIGVFTGMGAGLIALGCWYGPLVAGARCEETAMIDPADVNCDQNRICPHGGPSCPTGCTDVARLPVGDRFHRRLRGTLGRCEAHARRCSGLHSLRDGPFIRPCRITSHCLSQS